MNCIRCQAESPCVSPEGLNTIGWILEMDGWVCINCRFPDAPRVCSLAKELENLIATHATAAGNLKFNFAVVEVGRLKALLARHGEHKLT